LRRVGLQDVLQMECLARNSSILKIQAGNVQGLVYVKEGQNHSCAVRRTHGRRSVQLFAGAGRRRV
jgi:hypothetical protein